mgnify:CR=1 FL=1
MIYKTITKERLRTYLDSVRELSFLLEKKHAIERNMSLKGVDYSKSKVINGNPKKTSEAELYAIKLEKINSEIDRIKAFTVPEHNELVTQISRLSRFYWRRVITYKFLEGWKTSEIVSYFFSDEPDFEEEKEFKYKKKIERWLDEAIENLEKTSERPFIQYRQLIIEESENA